MELREVDWWVISTGINQLQQHGDYSCTYIHTKLSWFIKITITNTTIPNATLPVPEYNHAGYLVVYLQGSDKTLTFPTSGYASGQYLSVDVVSSPITCASTPDQVSQPSRRRLNSNDFKDATELATVEDRSDNGIIDLSRWALMTVILNGLTPEVTESYGSFGLCPSYFPSALDHCSNLTTTRVRQTSPSKHDVCWKQNAKIWNQLLRKTTRRRLQRQSWALFNRLYWTGEHLLTGWLPPSLSWEETLGLHQRSGSIDAIAWSLWPKLQVCICVVLGGRKYCCEMDGWDGWRNHAMYDTIHVILHVNNCSLGWTNQCHLACSECLVLW